MKFLTAQELKAKFDNNEIFQLIDLRGDYEFEDYNIGGINIPLENIFNSLDQVDIDKPVIFICNSGRKSAAVIHTIKRKLNLNNKDVYSLKGGVPNYIEEILS
jgi:rhodanese-related sulfurtransferase